MNLHVSMRIDRRCIRQLIPRSRDHYIFLLPVGNLNKIRVGAWLDRGVDKSHDIPYEPLKSAFNWIEDARRDDELLSMLRASAVGKRPSSSSVPDWRFSAGIYAPRLGATIAYLLLILGRLLQTIKLAILQWLRRS